jgi:hypothetical protein
MLLLSLDVFITIGKRGNNRIQVKFTSTSKKRGKELEKRKKYKRRKKVSKKKMIE